MITLFGKNGLALLEAYTFARTLYAFDFDGTLAKIVRSPENARMTAKTEALLRRLAELAPVAIVSGRSVADLRKRVSFEPAYLVGNHGLEGLGAKRDSLEKAASTCEAWKRSFADMEFPAGVEIEDKNLSLAIHYRRARARGRARKAIEEAIATLAPAPRLVRGKLVFNLLPPGAPHKGAAIQDLLRATNLTHVLYVGDDDTDEDVFGLKELGENALTVRVGCKSSSQAAWYIGRQSQIDRLLRCLVRFHEDNLSEEKRGSLHA